MCIPCQVFLLYGFEREVAPAVKKADWEKRPFGAHMDVARMVALQVRLCGVLWCCEHMCRVSAMVAIRVNGAPV